MPGGRGPLGGGAGGRGTPGRARGGGGGGGRWIVEPRFARARVRGEVIPVLRDLNPAAEHTIVETSRLLADESEVLERAVDEVLVRLGGQAQEIAELQALPRGLARLVLRRLAERHSAGTHSLSRADCDAILALGE